MNPDLQILGAIDIDVFDPVLSAFSRKTQRFPLPILWLPLRIFMMQCGKKITNMT